MEGSRAFVLAAIPVIRAMCRLGCAMARPVRVKDRALVGTAFAKAATLGRFALGSAPGLRQLYVPDTVHVRMALLATAHVRRCAQYCVLNN